MNILSRNVLLLILVSASACGYSSDQSEFEPNSRALSAEKDNFTDVNRSSNRNDQRYEIVRKRDVVVNGVVYDNLCEDLLKSLNSYKDSGPMVCSRQYNSQFGVEEPNWIPYQKDDIPWNIIKKIFSRNEGGSYEGQKRYEKWIQRKEELEDLANNRTILWASKVDIDNDGSIETLLMLKDSECGENKYYDYNAPDPHLYVLTESADDINEDFERITRYTFDVFLYKGNSYLSSWRGLKKKESQEKLYVYKTFAPRGKFGFSNYPICTYQYIR